MFSSTRKLPFAVALMCFHFSIANAQILDTISMGAGYANQVWYQFATDSVWKNPKSNYDLAFAVRTFDAAVWVNTPAGTSLFRSGKTAAQWSTVTDTVGSSPELFNSETSWLNGALNRTGNGVFDYGWGNYNQVSHDVIGDSVYFLRLPGNVFKKFLISKLAFDTSFFFKYANLDGSDERNVEIKKKDYAGKNFAYYSIQNNAALNREPLTKDWDITFLQYTGLVPDPTGNLQAYTLTGVLQNDSVKVSRVIRTDTASNSYNLADFKSEINQIGANWKSFNQTINVWTVSDNTTYFVQTRKKQVYKMIFTKFGGASTGDFIFKRLYILGTDVKEVLNGASQFTTYPNPAADGDVKVLYNLGNLNNPKADLRLMDLSGRTVFTTSIDASEGLHEYALPNLGLPSGVYLLALTADGRQTVQKLVIQ